MTAIWQRLFIGDFHDAGAIAGRNSVGITTVVGLCPEPIRAKAKGVNYLRFPLLADRPIGRGEFDRIIDALWENLRWGRVLIYSTAGTGRAPLVAAAWMHVVGYCEIDAALAEIRKLQKVRPLPVLLVSVKEML